MASSIWDAAQTIRSSAESIDRFLYVDGKTSPKVKVYKEHSEEEVRLFLDGLREELWREFHSVDQGMGWEK